MLKLCKSCFLYFDEMDGEVYKGKWACSECAEELALVRFGKLLVEPEPTEVMESEKLDV